jgi:hypothetical protein
MVSGAATLRFLLHFTQSRSPNPWIRRVSVCVGSIPPPCSRVAGHASRSRILKEPFTVQRESDVVGAHPRIYTVR